MTDPFIGEIKMVGFNFPPRSWANCDGQLLPISQNTALFSLVGTTFGGDGQVTFALPDLRGRSARHVSSSPPGLQPVLWGEKAGANQQILLVGQLPSHNHPLLPNGTDESANQTEPQGAVLAEGNKYYSGGSINQTSAPATTGNQGSNQPVNINNPFLGLYHVIALQGIYPSRN